MNEPTTADETTLSLKASLRRVVIAECLGVVIIVVVIFGISQLFNLRESVRPSIWISIVVFSAVRFLVSPRSRDAFYDGARLYGPGFTGRVSGEVKRVRRYGTLSKWLRLRQKITTSRESIYLDPMHYERADYESFLGRLRDVTGSANK